MGQNSGWLPANIGSNSYLAGSAHIKMAKKKVAQTIYSCKMIVLFSILKQLQLLAW